MKAKTILFQRRAAPSLQRASFSHLEVSWRRVNSLTCQFALSAAVLGILLAGEVQAQLIDVDFNTNSAAGIGGGPAVGPTMSGAAVLGTVGDHWNGVNVTSGTGIPLFYANGSNSPVTMTFTSGGGYDANSYGGSTPFASSPFDALMEDYLYSGGVTQTVILSGLTPRSMYDLVLYNAADAFGAGRTTSFTANSNLLSSTWNGSSGTLIAGVDYVEFASAMSDSSGNLAITWSGNGTAEGDLNGFQIQFKPAPAAPGLDPSFAGSGKTLITFGGDSCVANAVAIQPDGKIVIAGTTNNNSHSGLGLTRLNTDGSPDLSFGLNGKTTTSQMASATAVAIQSDGKIVAAGGSSGFQLARYYTNGLSDTSFGSNGIAGTQLVGLVQAVKIQSDGKIITVGAGGTSQPQFGVARFNTDGTLDNSFGSGGTVLTAFESGAVAVATGIQSDGKIVATGITVSQGGGEFDFATARYKTNGALDLFFGSLGRATNNVGSGTLDCAYAMAIQTDGKIVLAGSASFGSAAGPVASWASVNSFVALIRLNTNGTLDTTFGNNGSVVTEVGAYCDVAVALALQLDGKILLAGGSQSGNYQWFVQRYNSDGSPDPTYGDNSVRFVNFGSGTNEIAYALALDASGRAVVAGDAGGLFGVARLLQNGSSPVSLRISLTATNTALISWPYPSTGWNLRQNSNLATANWVTPPEMINNDGTNNFIVVSPRSGNLFFRLAQ